MLHTGDIIQDAERGTKWACGKEICARCLKQREIRKAKGEELSMPPQRYTLNE